MFIPSGYVKDSGGVAQTWSGSLPQVLCTLVSVYCIRLFSDTCPRMLSGVQRISAHFD